MTLPTNDWPIPARDIRATMEVRLTLEVSGSYCLWAYHPYDPSNAARAVEEAVRDDTRSWWEGLGSGVKLLQVATTAIENREGYRLDDEPEGPI